MAASVKSIRKQNLCVGELLRAEGLCTPWSLDAIDRLTTACGPCIRCVLCLSNASCPCAELSAALQAAFGLVNGRNGLVSTTLYFQPFGVGSRGNKCLDRWKRLLQRETFQTSDPGVSIGHILYVLSRREGLFSHPYAHLYVYENEMRILCHSQGYWSIFSARILWSVIISSSKVVIWDEVQVLLWCCHFPTLTSG